jgi:AcrR family transcriptional regulator
MAQRSKKDHIVATALPLFLENGFKGTSIDMVVRASGVSKPTVYNHFPDKAALMLAVIGHWIEINKPLIQPLQDRAGLAAFIREHWLTDEAVRFYAIVIGEGFRFAPAQELFWQGYDQRWRSAFAYLCDHSAEFDPAFVERELDRHLLERLRAQ